MTPTEIDMLSEEKIVMKKVLTFIVVLAGVSTSAWIISCRNDVIVPDPPTLIGDYKGIYSYLELDGVDTVVVKGQYITMRFTSSFFQMRWDETVNLALYPDTVKTRNFCDIDGDYTLNNGVQFIVLDSSTTPVVCRESQNPYGSFALDQSRVETIDTTYMNQILQDPVSGNQLRRTIRLVANNN